MYLRNYHARSLSCFYMVLVRICKEHQTLSSNTSLKSLFTAPSHEIFFLFVQGAGFCFYKRQARSLNTWLRSLFQELSHRADFFVHEPGSFPFKLFVPIQVEDQIEARERTRATATYCNTMQCTASHSKGESEHELLRPLSWWKSAATHMDICVKNDKYIQIYMYIHVYINICIYVYTYVYIYVYIYVFTNMYMSVYIYV